MHLLDNGAALCVVSVVDKGSVQQCPGPRSPSLSQSKSDSTHNLVSGE
jgi:hypothetical protein